MGLNPTLQAVPAAGRPFPSRALRHFLFGCLLMCGFASTPASAEPCPNEWNTLLQYAANRAEAQTWNDEKRYSIGTESFWWNITINHSIQGRPNEWANDPVKLRRAADIFDATFPTVTNLQSATYRYGACRARAKAAALERGVGGPANSSPKKVAPDTAARPASPRQVATPIEKLPPARPAKTAPWSPNAMQTDHGVKSEAMNPLFAAERADALASCQPSIQQYGSRWALTSVETNITIENSALNDRTMKSTPAQLRAHLATFDTMISSGQLSREAAAMGRCLLNRRIAQLEGSPLVPGAVDGTLNPISIGGKSAAWKQQGKDARIIASDGKSAMHCVKLVKLSDKDSIMGMGGRVLSNQCEGPVEITWCYVDSDCYKGVGNAWTVGAGRSWPVSVERELRWAACHGANTASFVKGSYGLRYYCSAPAKK